MTEECGFDMGWGGVCHAPAGDDGRCDRHRGLACDGCEHGTPDPNETTRQALKDAGARKGLIGPFDDFDDFDDFARTMTGN